MKSASNNLVGLDNYTRPAEQETELNSLFLYNLLDHKGSSMFSLTVRLGINLLSSGI